MPQDKRLWHTTIISCVTSILIRDVGRVMHGIIVLCHDLLSCGIYTALVSLVFGTAIPTSFSILFLHWFFAASQSLNLEANAMACYSPTLFPLHSVCMIQGCWSWRLGGGGGGGRCTICELCLH